MSDLNVDDCEGYFMKKDKRLQKLGIKLFFMLPMLTLFFMAIIIPFAFGIYFTFMSMEVITDTPVWSGLSNYKEAFSDKRFWEAMLITGKYVVVTVIFVNTIAFLLALLVTSGIKGQNIFRTTIFAPNLIGGLVLGYIWQFIFVQSLPNLGQRFDIEFIRLGWLGDPTYAFWSLIIVTTWQMSGYMMIILIAGLVNVPNDIIEASKIDGAGVIQRLRCIILPMMRPAFVITIFMTLKSAFMVYDINYSLTQGGPFGSTVMVSMHIVNKAFNQQKFGVGQAQAILLFVIVAVISGIQVYIGKKGELKA